MRSQAWGGGGGREGGWKEGGITCAHPLTLQLPSSGVTCAHLPNTPSSPTCSPYPPSHFSHTSLLFTWWYPATPLRSVLFSAFGYPASDGDVVIDDGDNGGDDVVVMW